MLFLRYLCITFFITLIYPYSVFSNNLNSTRSQFVYHLTDRKVTQGITFNITQDVNGVSGNYLRENIRAHFLASPTWAFTYYAMNDPNTQSHLSIQRIGETLYFKGTYRNKFFEKHEKIDEAPWYQSFELCFQPFILHKKQEQLFWAVRPNDLRVYKFIVTYQGFTDIEFKGKALKAHQVKVTLPDWKGMFWKATYFLDANGVLLSDTPSEAGKLKRIKP